MIKHFLTNSSGILFSRILGFIRDLLSANALGASIYSDIFFIAFKIPNLFRRIFAEGAFTNTFIPFFSSCKNKIVFTNYIFYKLLFIIMAISIGVTIFPKAIAYIFATGLSDELKELVSPLIAINFYYLDFIFIVAVLSSILQYNRHFVVTAYSTAILNLSIILAILLASDLEEMQIIYYMSISVLVGGFMQVVVHIIALKRLGLLRLFNVPISLVYRKTITIKKEIKEFDKSFMYSVLGQSTANFSSFIDTFLASFLISGSISYLYYANRIFQLPLALFSIALSIALFPLIANMVNKKQKAKIFRNIKKSFYILIFSLSLSSIIGIYFANEIIWLLFERGAFTRADTLESAKILMAYLIGLIPFGISKIFTLWLYSYKKHKLVAKISAYSLLGNILLSIAFIIPFQAFGLALASSLSGFILLFLSIKSFGFNKFKLFIFNKIMIFYMLFCIGVVVVCYFSKIVLQNFIVI